MTRIAVRGYVHGRITIEEFADIGDDEIEVLLRDLAEKHAKRLAEHSLHMIEIEFLDEPNQNERFFRFGTDPSAMVAPLRVDLGAL
jgi:hypothetical protein